MTPLVSQRRLLIGGALVGMLVLAACGKQGALDRPGPLFGGGQTRSSTRAQRAAADRAANQASPDSSATSQTNGDYSQPSDGAKDPALTPMRSSPPPGMPSDPLGNNGRGGVLPDPFSDPNRAPR
jgi:hypothetical protein